MIGSGCERCGQGGMIVPLSRRGRRAWTDTGAWITVAKKRPGCPGSDFFLVERSYVCHLFALRISLSPPLSPHLPTILSRPFMTSMPVTRDRVDRDPLSAALRPPIDETEEEKASRLAEEDAAKRVSHAIDEAIRIEKQQRKKHKIVRLLLLGQSESGPSLVFRRVSVLVYRSPSSQANLPPSAVSLSSALWVPLAPGRA